MKKYKNSTIFLEGFIATLFFFSIEVIFRVIEGFNLFDYATLRIFLSCMTLSFILEFFLSFIKTRKKRDILHGIFLFVVTIYTFVQAGFRNFLGIFISVGTSGQMSAVQSYIVNFIKSYKPEYYTLFIPFLLFLVFTFLKKKGSDIAKFSWYSRVLNLCMSSVLVVVYIATLMIPFMQNSMQLIDNKTLFLVPTNSSIAVNQFGTTIYGLSDIRHLILPITVLNEVENEEPEIAIDTTRTFDDTAWLDLIATEKNTLNNRLNRYFQGRTISQPNDYTGYFEGKNLIVIMMESINNVIENKEYFPNFARMLESGWYWENNYSPRNACATGDNEFSGMTSLYPINTSCTVNVTPKNTYFTAIFNQFNNRGYTTSSYHDLDSTYYERAIFHKNMGSGAYYDGNDLDMDVDASNYLEWPSDVEMMEKASEHFLSDEPFMVWMTTVTAHQPYEESSTYGDLYYDLFDDTDYSDSVKRYLSKTKVTDDALGRLMDLLNDAGKLDDTVIILYGDHYPYGLSNKDVSSMVDYDIDEFYEIERTPFLIYNNQLTAEVFSEKTFYMNLLPTVANLFNLEYDPRFYLGEDLFSESFSGRVVFADGSWEDEIARYNAVNSEVTYFQEGKTYSASEIQKINRDIYNKKTMSKLAIDVNYFDYLEKELNKKTK